MGSTSFGAGDVAKLSLQYVICRIRIHVYIVLVSYAVSHAISSGAVGPASTRFTVELAYGRRLTEERYRRLVGA